MDPNKCRFILETLNEIKGHLDLYDTMSDYLKQQYIIIYNYLLTEYEKEILKLEDNSRKQSSLLKIKLFKIIFNAAFSQLNISTE